MNGIHSLRSPRNQAPFGLSLSKPLVALRQPNDRLRANGVLPKFLLPARAFVALLLAFGGLGLAQAAPLKIVATLPEWGALAEEIGGARVQVFTVTTGLQDPHRIQAKPSLIAKLRDADLVIATGAELEMGWLPLALRESGNAKTQMGQPGVFEAASFVTLQGVPTRLDRALGDVHPAGNPHIQTDARNILAVAQALGARLTQLDSAGAAYYQARLGDFAQRWRSAMQRWEQQAAPLRGIPVIVQHDAFAYLIAWLGFKQIAALEPKPGQEPSGAYLQTLLQQQSQTPARMILRAAYQPDASARWFTERAHLPIATLPFTIGGDAQAQNLFALFDDTLQRLLGALAQAAP